MIDASLTPNKRPISVLIIACLYFVVGVAGFAHHFHGLVAFQSDAIWAELTEFVAIVCAVFLLLRQNWARWLALAWIAFHVILSAFHALPELLIHALLCLVIAWCLFGPAATRYFRGAKN